MRYLVEEFGFARQDAQRNKDYMRQIQSCVGNNKFTPWMNWMLGNPAIDPNQTGVWPIVDKVFDQVIAPYAALFQRMRGSQQWPELN